MYSSESPFFTAPLEVRHHIYRILLGSETHLFLYKGQLHTVPCQGPEDESWRRPQSDTVVTDARWIRRVESRWGSHWKCEEVYLDGLEEPKQASHMPLLSLLLCSKSIFFDVIGFLSQPTQCVHMTDLKTIDHVLPNSLPNASADSTIASNSREPKKWPLTKSMRNISLTLHLSLPMLSTLFVPYYSKEDPRWAPPPRPFATPEGSGCKQQYEQWMRIWPALLELPCLQRFTLWLDHLDIFSWDVVGERDVLQNLSNIMPVFKSRNTQVIVNLPTLGDKTDCTDEEHFVEKHPEFEIQRRTRLPLLGDRSWQEGSDYEVYWIENEVNGVTPPEFPGFQVAMGRFHLTTLREIGYDVESREFQEHPWLGYDLPTGCKWNI